MIFETTFGQIKRLSYFIDFTDIFNLIAETPDRAYNTNIAGTIVLGDLNDVLSSNEIKLKEPIYQYISELITEATNFNENQSSLGDIVLVRNNSNKVINGVADPLIPDKTKYNCSICIVSQIFSSIY